MLDRALLSDMGFELGTDFDHEVWVYKGIFWVHFGEYASTPVRDWSSHVGTETMDRPEFFKKFIEAVCDAHCVGHYGW